MKLTSTIIAATLAASSAAANPVHVADVSDAASTTLLISTGDFVEGNTIIYGTTPSFGNIMAAKIAVRVLAGDNPTANVIQDAASYGAAIHNMALLAGATPMGAVAVGAAGAMFIIADKPPHEPPTKCAYGEYLHSGRVCIEVK